MSLRATLAADLLANAGTRGWRKGLRAFFTVPGFYVIAMHRIAARLARLHRLTGELLWHHNLRSSGCHLHLDARIGPGLTLPHPTGIVVGSGAWIGAGVTLYQSVTVGRRPERAGYPRIADRVTIYPGAVIVGPVSIGEGAVIGALSYVDRDVPAGSVARGNPLRISPAADGGDQPHHATPHEPADRERDHAIGTTLQQP